MEFLNRIFSLFSKADRAMYQANRMQRTVDQVGNQSRNLSNGKFKTILYVLIAVVAILYFVLG